MPSPFPGMDPFIEACGYFAEFHGSMIVAIRDEFNLRLPERFVATLEMYSWIHGGGAPRQGVEPDTYRPEEPGRKGGTRGVARLTAPRTIVLPSIQRRREKYVQISDLRAKRVVSVVEMLRPNNKGVRKERDLYLSKRGRYRANAINVVEIDLVRSGTRLPIGDPTPERSDYYALVASAWDSPRAGFWSFSIRDPLPDLPVPLAPDLPDVFLPLRQCATRVYEGARYGSKLDYDKPLTPRPGRRDAAWIREVLAQG